MGAVQHPQLHVLEGGHVVDHLRPGGGEVGPVAVHEIVLHRPLAEGFVHDGGGVVPARQAFDHRDVGVGRGGGYPVDHGGGKAPLRRDPLRQRGVDPAGKVQHYPAHQRAVVRKVVAGQHRERRQPRIAPPLQGTHDVAGGRARQVVRQIMRNVRVIDVQVARRRIVAIALLGHGQRDDLHPRIGHGREHRRRVFRRHQHVVQHVDHPCLRPVRRQRDRGIGPALRPQRVAGVGGAQADAHDPPVAPRRLHRVGDSDAAEGAEKGAEAQVHDARAGARAGGAGQAFSGQASLHRR